jgi:phage shock protein A
MMVGPDEETVEGLRQQVEELRKQIAALEKQLEELKAMQGVNDNV